MDIFYYLAVLKKRIWWLITIPILAMGAAFLFTLRMEKIYSSTTHLATGLTTNADIQITNEKFNPRTLELKFSNLIQTMHSELVVSMVSYKLILHDLTSEVPFRTYDNDFIGSLGDEHRNTLIELFERKITSFELLDYNIPEETSLRVVLNEFGYSNWILKQSLEIKRLKNTDYLTIKYWSENPQVSAFVVNNLADEFIRYDNFLLMSKANKSLNFFRELADGKKRALEESTELVRAFKFQNQVIDYNLETTSVTTQIANYEMQKNEELKIIRNLDLSIENLNRKLRQAEEKIDGSPASINAKILELRARITELNKIYLDGGSNDSELLEVLNDLRDQLQIEISKLSYAANDQSTFYSRGELLEQREELQLQLRVAKENLISLTSTISNLKSSISGFVSKEATIQRLEEEMTRASNYYSDALTKYNIEKTKSMVSEGSVRIIVRGQPSNYPETSKAQLIIAFSGASSLTICMFVFIFLELIDFRIKTPSRFQSKVNMKLLGCMNTIKIDNVDLSELFRVQESHPELELFKETLRKIRYELESSGHRSILVTSNKVKEGKTFFILCLAFSLSLLRKRILIIDTNFKNNSLTKHLLPKPIYSKMLERGLVPEKILPVTTGSGTSGDDDQIKNLISSTSHAGIDIIGNNRTLDSPSEIFAGKNFAALLMELNLMYDYILMEGPALNDFSDTKELAEFTQSVVVLYSANSSITQRDGPTAKFYQNLGTKLTGAVLNQVDSKNIDL